MDLCLIVICLLFSWKFLLLTLAIIVWLSQCIHTSCIDLETNVMSIKISWSHPASKLVVYSAINSAFHGGMSNYSLFNRFSTNCTAI